MDKTKKSETKPKTFNDLNNSVLYQQNWPIFFGDNMSFFVKKLSINTHYAKNKVVLQKKKHSTIRPLLSLKRFETGIFCTFWQLPIYPDLSNQKVKFLRNRIRKQLLPALKMFFNPQVENVLLQFAEIVEAEDLFMNQTTNKLAEKFIKTKKKFHHDVFILTPLHTKSTHFFKIWQLWQKCLSANSCMKASCDSKKTESTIVNTDVSLNRVQATNVSYTNYTQIRRIYETLIWRTKYAVATKSNKKLRLAESDCIVDTKMSCKELIDPNISNPLNFFTRFSISKRTAYWMWNRRLITFSHWNWNNSLKTGIECALLTIPNFSTFPATFQSKLRKKNSNLFKEKFLESTNKITGANFNSAVGINRSNDTTVVNTNMFNSKESALVRLNDDLEPSSSSQNVKPGKVNKGITLTGSTKILTFNGSYRIKGFKTQKGWLSGDLYNKQMNSLFMDNFVTYFDTLEMEKKEIYWPLMISFFPKAFQRRVVKLVLKTQNWKQVRYSHIEKFLTKKCTPLNSV